MTAFVHEAKSNKIKQIFKKHAVYYASLNETIACEHKRLVLNTDGGKLLPLVNNNLCFNK